MGVIGTLKCLIRIIIVAGCVSSLNMLLSAQGHPVISINTHHRMLKPPTFPYGNLPPGYTSSGLLCPLISTPYMGGWFGRSCAGPIPPFRMPSPTTATTSTTEKPDNDEEDEVEEEDEASYGSPIEGSPWDPDDEDLFIENYGRRAAKPGFRLGDPNRRF